MNDEDLILALMAALNGLRKELRSIMAADEAACERRNGRAVQIDKQLKRIEEILRQRMGLTGNIRVGQEPPKWHWEGDTLKVHLDRGEPFSLPFQLGHFFAYLASHANHAHDELTSWLTRKEIAGYLTKETKHEIPVKRVANLIYRLKQEFECAKLERSLIQTSKRDGVRLVLPRASANGMSGDVK